MSDEIPSTLKGAARVDFMLREELRRLRPELDAQLPKGDTDASVPVGESLAAHYQTIGNMKGAPLSALCLSGGGIRSATFNLGVLQMLARTKVLGEFDYLSSVSGGGYIASWLRTWMFRVGSEPAIAELGRRPQNPVDPEPAPVSNLRAFSNYLTPKLGLLSGDTWTAAAIVLRNLILNWLVILPLLAAVIGLPQLFALTVGSFPGFPSLGPILLGLALAIELLSSILVYRTRRFCTGPVDAHGRPRTQKQFILSCAMPVCLAASALATAGVFLDPTLFVHRWSLHVFAAVWCVVIPILGWAFAEVTARITHKPLTETNAPGATAEERQPDWQGAQRRGSASYELVALAVSGVIGAYLLIGVTNFGFELLRARPKAYVVLVLPILLGIYLIARTLFVGLASLSEGVKAKTIQQSASDDDDREWWARMSGWILLVTIGWLVVTGLCLFSLEMFERLMASFMADPDKTHVPIAIRLIQAAFAGLGGAAGLIAAFAGSRDNTAPGAPQAEPSLARRIVQAIAAPLFAVCLVVLIAWETDALRAWVTPAILGLIRHEWLPGTEAEKAFYEWILFALLLVALYIVAVFAGRVVNVNRFSLQGMYRNRLVRAYLGASNPDRKPNPFTGFAWADNPKLHELWQTNATKPAMKPLPIINTTLNLVSGEKLAWQQRKAESFAMTPFYCGSIDGGYRNSKEYGGRTGVSVGTAVTISGAAANPNMGFNSSPALGFVMAMFNVRLGAWLGNTNDAGHSSHRHTGPRQAIQPLIAELFGLTNARSKYISLSDGGHFDNLGLYEIVLRRCRRVVVCDAGCDGKFAFDDLGNAIRKIRIDFGVRIEFRKEITIEPSSVGKQGLYCALASIHYSDVDGTSAENDGWLIYVKPTLLGQGAPLPYDIYNYSRSSKDFPHESTADQWFSESQFESYRALGFHALGQICGGETAITLEQLLDRVKTLVDGPYVTRRERGYMFRRY